MIAREKKLAKIAKNLEGNFSSIKNAPILWFDNYRHVVYNEKAACITRHDINVGENRWHMITNNIELDVKVKLLEAGTTQEKLGETIGTTGQYVNRILKKNNEVVNKTFIKMMEALGYDIQLVYVKREG